MRRTAQVVLLAAVSLFVVGAPVPAGAEPVDPSGLRFSSPSEAASGTPMWIRSISPCPAASSSRVHRFVEAWISPQAGANRSDLGEVTGDVDDSGRWEVTLIAPNGPSAGATAHFYIRAACLEDDPWAAAPLDEDTQVKPVAVAYYEVNSLWVTSSGGGGNDGEPSEFVPDPAQYDVVTTTTAPRDTTTTIATTTPLSAAGLVTMANARDEAVRAAEARAELDGRDPSAKSVVAIGGAPASSSGPAGGDGGIPWWSFVLATLLATGAVVGWGARRSPTVWRVDD